MTCHPCHGWGSTCGRRWWCADATAAHHGRVERAAQSSAAASRAEGECNDAAVHIVALAVIGGRSCICLPWSCTQGWAWCSLPAQRACLCCACCACCGRAGMCTSWSPSGSCIASAHQDGTVAVWDIRSDTVVQVRLLPAGLPRAAASTHFPHAPFYRACSLQRMTGSAISGPSDWPQLTMGTYVRPVPGKWCPVGPHRSTGWSPLRATSSSAQGV